MNLHSQIMSLRLQFDAELEEAKNTAYSEGRKDEREASCVDELVATLKECAGRLEIHMKHTEDLAAHMKACAVLTKLEQTK